jgi:hypothetical protein
MYKVFGHIWRIAKISSLANNHEFGTAFLVDLKFNQRTAEASTRSLPKS